MEGGSLADHLARYQNDPREAVRLFLPVVRAIQHAHQHAVLHRDLKASNILLDTEGRAHVTDFGLARRLDADSSLTKSGSIVGTPSYMAPEQVTAPNRPMATAIDVYGLGAVLYALLTGRAPFSGETVLDTIEQVQEKEADSPRRLNPLVDRDLATICLKCLHKEPERRYGSAEALAADLERWLKGNSIVARPIGSLEKLWRWCRRNPVVAILSVAVAVLLLVTTAVLGVSLVRVREEIGRKEEALNREAEQRRRAETIFRLAGEGLQQSLEKVTSDPRLQSGPNEDLRRKVHEAEKAFYEKFVAVQGDDPAFQLERAQVHARLAFYTDQLGSKEEALGHSRQALAICTKLAADYPEVVLYRSELGVCNSNAGELCRLTGRFPEAETYLQEALRIDQAVVRDHSDVAEYQVLLARAQNNLAILYWQMHRQKEAEQVLNDGLAVLKKVVSANPDHLKAQLELARTYSNLGLLYKDIGRPKEATRAFQESVTRYKALVRKDPKAAEYQFHLATNLSNLGMWYSETKELQKAEEVLNEAIDDLTVLTRKHPAVPLYQLGLGLAYVNLGNVYKNTRKSQDAERSQRQALKLIQKLADDYPAFPDYQNRLAVVLYNLADSLLESDPGSARRLLEEALAHQQAAMKANPDNLGFRIFLRHAYLTLGETHLRLQDHAEAAKAAEEIPRLAPDDWQAHTTAAHLLARCVPLAEKDGALPEVKRKELVENYAERAVFMLRKAGGKGFSDAPALEDEVFKPLRQRKDFQEVLNGLQHP